MNVTTDWCAPAIRSTRFWRTSSAIGCKCSTGDRLTCSTQSVERLRCHAERGNEKTHADFPLPTPDRHHRGPGWPADLDPFDQFDAASADSVGGDGIPARQPEAEQHVGDAQAASAAVIADCGHCGGAGDGYAADRAKHLRRAVRERQAAPYRA